MNVTRSLWHDISHSGSVLDKTLETAYSQLPRYAAGVMVTIHVLQSLKNFAAYHA